LTKRRERGSGPSRAHRDAGAKYYLNKRVAGHVAECIECHGGAGYVEEWPIARLYRQAPLTASGKAQAT
jgi:alkylation response protein AidB-like acyl-CoA dehydrogenase